MFQSLLLILKFILTVRFPSYIIIIIYIYDAYVRICVLSNANFNVPYLSLQKQFSPEILRVV